MNNGKEEEMNHGQAEGEMNHGQAEGEMSKKPHGRRSKVFDL